MSGVRNDVIFVFCGQVLVHDVDAMRQHAVAAELRRPQLNRYLDVAETIGGKEHAERVGDDGGLDARIVRHGPRELLCAHLVADMGFNLRAKLRDAGPIRIGADYRKPGVAAARKSEQTDSLAVDAVIMEFA